nr:MAG: putative RNA-dependent RNA polymerase [Botourmiaviridae sp.]
MPGKSERRVWRRALARSVSVEEGFKKVPVASLSPAQSSSGPPVDKKRGRCLGAPRGWTEFHTQGVQGRTSYPRGIGPSKTENKKNKTKFLGLLPDRFDDSCDRQEKLAGKALACIDLLVCDQDMRDKLKGSLPPSISCLTFRSAVRSCFADLTLVQELSVKTSMKLITSYCASCITRSSPLDVIGEWKRARGEAQTVDELHLEEFRRMFRRNVPVGWNTTPGPYIPNGSASLTHGRCKGGNWNIEPFSKECRVCPVISSGKQRVVTLYSSHNLKVLTPLHKSLYRALARGGWLLVGPPKSDNISFLNGDGDYVSVDASGATDSFKRVYVRVMIQELISSSRGLTKDQVRCLRTVGELVIDGESTESGQPMGSPMSFPLLCLMTKTLFDMSLTDLLRARKVSFKEWTGLRCLVNGDDLLYREPSKRKLMLKERLNHHYSAVGMRMNEEKTSVDSVLAEINSTAFENGRELRKTNVKALYMAKDEQDVLGYALRSTRCLASFRRVVRANARLLAKQENKTLFGLPTAIKRTLWRDRKIRRALTEVWSQKQDPTRNLMTVERLPHGYDLTREEEVTEMNACVDRIRDQVIEDKKKQYLPCGGRIRFVEGLPVIVEGLTEHVLGESEPIVDDDWVTVYKDKRPIDGVQRLIGIRSRKSLLREVPTLEEDEKILSCLARAWETKQKARLVEEAVGTADEGLETSHLDGAKFRTPTVFRIVEAIRASRLVAELRRSQELNLSGVPHVVRRCPQILSDVPETGESTLSGFEDMAAKEGLEVSPSCCEEPRGWAVSEEVRIVDTRWLKDWNLG